MRPEKSEMRIVAILCLTVGVVNFEMLGISNLIPFIEPDLHLNNKQIGMLLSGFWLTFAISSYLAGARTDAHGKYKALLLVMLLLFSGASILSGFAQSFTLLLVTRLLMGLLDGPIYLIPQSIVVLESPAEHSGLNMGIVQNLGTGILGAFVAPLLLVNLASNYSWRVGFFVVALPGLICAALVSRYVREPIARIHVRGAARSNDVSGLRDILRFRNVWLCTVISSLALCYITVTFGFLPLFFIKIRHFTPGQMSVLMSLLGVSGLVLGIALPAFSDRIGRKPIIFGASLLSAVSPLAAMYYSGPVAILGLFVFVGWALAGAAALTFATIPCESVPARSMSTAIGLILAVSTLLGGVVGPAVAGWSADKWGVSAPLFLTIGCCVVVAVTSLAMQETAPAKVKNLATHAASVK
jgi:predicted MFS family arabinose efflux permease